jgi:hypothetical protein
MELGSKRAMELGSKRAMELGSKHAMELGSKLAMELGLSARPRGAMPLDEGEPMPQLDPDRGNVGDPAPLILIIMTREAVSRRR